MYKLRSRSYSPPSICAKVFSRLNARRADRAVVSRLRVVTAFKTDFGPRELPQPENAWMWKCNFSSLGNSRGPKSVWKQFSNKVLYNYCSKFFVGAFRSVSKKKGFSIGFLKSDLTLVGFYFLAENKSEKAKHPGLCQTFGGNMPEAQIGKVHFMAPRYD